MITIRKSADRGHFDHGWLDTRHTFSFGDYHDPRHMGFRSLRVINEDRVLPGQGFGTHGHANMEILSCVLEGALQHSDSMGNGSVIQPGDLQRMSAGTGVRHSESNPSPKEPVHFLQIWILPESKSLPPEYEQKHFSESQRRGKLLRVASREGRDGAVTVHQDVELYATLLAPRERVEHTLEPERHAWLQVARGSVRLNGELLQAGDGAAVSGEPHLTIGGVEDAEALLFDLA